MPAEEAPKIGEELDLDWIHGSKVVPPPPSGGGGDNCRRQGTRDCIDMLVNFDMCLYYGVKKISIFERKDG